jgi:hypothetical protein
MKYILIGGNPFTSYTGTGSFSSLKVAGSADSAEDIQKLWHEKYDECGGLMMILDRETGEDVTEVIWPKELIDLHNSYRTL